MSRTKTKRYLMLLAAVGLIAAGLGGAGTFASFNAEVANNGNYFATGSLLLHDTGNGTNTCTSETDTTANSNVATSNTCDVLFNYPLSDTSPHFASLTLTNAGTLDAQVIQWSTTCDDAAADVNATLQTPLVFGVSPSSLVISKLVGSAVVNSVTVTYGRHTQIFATSAAALGSTSITVDAGQPANFAYPATSAIHVTGTGPTFGSSPAHDLCRNLELVVIETDSTGTPIKCVYGAVDVSTCAFNAAHTLKGTDAPTSLADLAVDAGGTNTSKLDANGSRYFSIGLQPLPTAGNTLQNRAATFDLKWHIES